MIETKPYWDQYRKDGTVPQGEEILLEMMNDLCEAFQVIFTIDRNRYQIFLNDISSTHCSLCLIAQNRNIDYDKLPKLID